MHRKQGVNRPVSYQPESREQPGEKKGCGCGEAYKGPGTSGKLSSGSGGRREDRSRPVREIKGHRNRQSRTSTRPISHQVISRGCTKGFTSCR